MDVLLVAVKKDKILNHTNVLAQAGKTPVVVDIDAFALQNCFEVNYDPDPGQTVALPNVGASVMNINIVRVGILIDRKSTRLNSSHGYISYAVFCLKKKKQTTHT